MRRHLLAVAGAGIATLLITMLTIAAVGATSSYRRAGDGPLVLTGDVTPEVRRSAEVVARAAHAQGLEITSTELDIRFVDRLEVDGFLEGQTDGRRILVGRNVALPERALLHEFAHALVGVEAVTGNRGAASTSPPSGTRSGTGWRAASCDRSAGCTTRATSIRRLLRRWSPGRRRRPLAEPAVSGQTRAMGIPRSPRHWSDLSTDQQRAIIAVGVITTIWQFVMLWDLSHRPAEEVRGSKRAWVVASFVRPVGQIAYYGWGRRR